MRSVMSAQQMREVDKYMIETLQIPSLVLMENAAMGTARLVMEKAPDPCVVHVFCGTGNNGGDGLACARALLARGYDAYVVIVGDMAHMTADAAENYAFFEHFPDRVLIVAAIEDLYGWRVPKADVIVDAVFGTGLKREVAGVYADVIASMNSAHALRVSVDIPSGIDADTGRVLGIAVEADCTATFQYPKIGHYMYPGREHTGELRVVPIGIDKGVEAVVNSRMVAYESDDPDILIPMRAQDTNKGSYGRLLLLAGCRGMAGAAVMSARAAYAAGTGLVTVAAPWAVIDVMQSSVPEATCELLPEEEGRLYIGSMSAIEEAARGKTALAVGPGLGQGKGLKSVISEILTTLDLCRVVDADALNALDKDLKVLAHIHGDVVFTPHPLEFARLLGTELHSVLEHPLELATAFAQKCRVTLVLKGATTIIAGPSGQITFVAAGSPGMAKAGSGDVLTGTIAGLAAQGVPSYEAAVLGVYLCAMAGESAAEQVGEYSATPEDTIRNLGPAIKNCLSPDIPAWSLAKEAVHEVSQSRHAEKAELPKSIAAESVPSSPTELVKVVRTSAQRTQTKEIAEEDITERAPAVPVDSIPEEVPGQTAMPTDSTSVREALNTISAKKSAPAVSEQVQAKPAEHQTAEEAMAQAEAVRTAVQNASSSHAQKTAAVGSGEVHQPEHSRRGRGTRMSAADVRPPRIPPQPAPAQEAQDSPGSQEPTKVVEPLDKALSGAGSHASGEEHGTHQHNRRAEHHGRSEKSHSGRKLEASESHESTEQSAEVEAEEKKRERLNHEIRQELSAKDKSHGRTRRRIG